MRAARRRAPTPAGGSRIGRAPAGSAHSTPAPDGPKAPPAPPSTPRPSHAFGGRWWRYLPLPATWRAPARDWVRGSPTGLLVLALVYAYFRRREIYNPFRDSVLLANSLGLLGYLLFPPAPPQDVRAIYTAGAVELVWAASTEPDLAGYNVWRRENGKSAVQINKELLRTPVFRDTSVEPGHRYFYRVTAEDMSGNQSAPSEEAEIQTQ